ncbi:MAG: TIGR03668 family PPOX class F420-dependent oxidoreductase [Chloroflexi bacterium]|nr:TIGR03668 family PPOX class F420-dependent oxidoreductase [Chloroflexota bacterium]
MGESIFTDWEARFLREQPVARFATLDEMGQPHVLPIVFVLDEHHQLFTPIDGKKKRLQDAYRLRRVRNIQRNPVVGLVCDVYHDDWSQLAWVKLQGQADLLESGGPFKLAQQLLRAKYPQYAQTALGDQLIIRIRPTKVTSWQAG